MPPSSLRIYLGCCLAGLAFLASCTAPTATQSPMPTPDPAQSIIFSAEQARAFQLELWMSEAITDYWTPTPEAVAALEAQLGDYLAQHQTTFFRPTADLLTYQRQYVGLVYGEQQVVYANFFCTSASMDWQNDFVLVMDGGDCFFQVKYDMATGEFFDLRVNGEA